MARPLGPPPDTHAAPLSHGTDGDNLLVSTAGRAGRRYHDQDEAEGAHGVEGGDEAGDRELKDTSPGLAVPKPSGPGPTDEPGPRRLSRAIGRVRPRLDRGETAGRTRSHGNER